MNQIEKQALYDLMSKLNKEIDGRIYMTRLSWGRYLTPYRAANKEFMCHNDNALNYNLVLLPDNYLRIEIGALKKKIPMGEGMAALSDFYTVLREEYGEPSVFYITKNILGDQCINLQWMFKEKKPDESNLNDYLNNLDRIQSVIMLNNNYSYSDEMIMNKFLLPVQLLDLIGDDLENYIKYRSGKGHDSVSDNTSIDLPYPIGTYLTCSEDGKIHIDKVLRYVYDKNGLSVILTEDIFTHPRSSVEVSIDKLYSKWQLLDLSQNNSKKRVKEK